MPPDIRLLCACHLKRPMQASRSGSMVRSRSQRPVLACPAQTRNHAGQRAGGTSDDRSGGPRRYGGDAAGCRCVRQSHRRGTDRPPPAAVPTYEPVASFQASTHCSLGSSGGPEQRTRLVPSEKCAASWGSEDADMRMITASVVRVLQKYTDALHTHSLLIFQ